MDLKLSKAICSELPPIVDKRLASRASRCASARLKFVPACTAFQFDCTPNIAANNALSPSSLFQPDLCRDLSELVVPYARKTERVLRKQQGASVKMCAKIAEQLLVAEGAWISVTLVLPALQLLRTIKTPPGQTAVNLAT